ncbi:hypothetical protein GMRT_12881 [Giardia muris]|uniref:Uncharacterized protein n=1 Tax=Giardia muris TaxID=5742 RepID=A0A4Z1SPM0_GIAMU|nr:hypothetical protein GMRT_12881 [Giardia muris]|eukprot:TNJ27600.1 hypothetical protein GMRT_12881 [Giardia muris]
MASKTQLVMLGSSGLMAPADAPGLTLFRRLADTKSIVIEELASLRSLQKKKLSGQVSLDNVVIPVLVESFDPETQIGLLTDLLHADIYSLFESVDSPVVHGLICVMHPWVECVGPWLVLRVSDFMCFGPSPDIVPCKARSAQSGAPCGAIAHRIRGYCHRHALRLAQIDTGENFYQAIKIGNLIEPLLHFSGDLSVAEIARRLRPQTSTLPSSKGQRKPATIIAEQSIPARVKIPLQPKAGFTPVHAHVCHDCQHASTDVLKDCLLKGHQIETRIAKSYNFKCATCCASRTSISRMGPTKPCRVCASLSWKPHSC